MLRIGLTADGANEIARRARGTDRIAGRLLRRVRDFASVTRDAAIDRAVADAGRKSTPPVSMPWTGAISQPSR